MTNKKGHTLFRAFMFIVIGFAYPATAQEFSGGVMGGFTGGKGFQVNGMVSDLARDFPFRIKLGIGYITSDPGDAAGARRIFINNATNGTPLTKGHRWDFRMDFTYPVDVLSLKHAFFYAGPRFSKFTGNFKYVGGNEDFDITCDQWAMGIGLEKYFRMSSKLDLVTTTGLDYFFGHTLQGHDTSYSPDGTSVNGREDYTYSDADGAVNQPKFEFVLMLGLNYHFRR